MSNTPAPEKKRPRLWLILLGAVLAVLVINIVIHWADFKAGFREGFAHASAK